MVRFLILITLLIAGVIGAPYLMGNKGYVMIAAGDYTIDATVSSIVIMIVTFYLTLLAVESLINKFFYGLGWFSRRKKRVAKKHTERGILALVAGDYKTAEKLSLKGAKRSQVPVLNYLAAAESAQGLGNDESRDKYLRLAHENASSDTFAIEITQAKLQIQQKQFEQALSTLMALHEKQPKHKVVLGLLKDVCLERKEWDTLLSLIPKLLKQKLITSDEASSLRAQTHFNRLAQIAKREGSAGLVSAWDKLPRALKHDTSYLAEVCEQLIKRNDDQSAYLLIMDALAKEMHPELISIAARLRLSDHHVLIERLKSLQKSRQGSGLLAVTIGQLLVKEGRWEEAIPELEKGIQQTPSVAAFAALATAYEKLNRTDEANQTYKQGFEFSHQS